MARVCVFPKQRLQPLHFRRQTLSAELLWSPLPVGWDVDWSVVNSTALMSTNPAGFVTNHTWGWVTLDWQANRAAWLNDDPRKTTCEATSSANCVRLKEAGKVKRCGIYHNMELSLQ